MLQRVGSALPERLADGVASVTEGVTGMTDAFVSQSAYATGMVADTLDAVFATGEKSGDEAEDDDDEFVVSTRVETGPALPKTALKFFSTDGKTYEELLAQEIDEALEYRSLGFFPRDHPMRVFCVSLLKWKWWSTVVTFAVFLNCVCLAVRQPTQPEDSPANTFTSRAEYVFTGVFTGELLINLVALGLFRHPSSFLRSGWNSLDFCIVFLSLLSLFPISAAGALSLRTVRLLKPLRTISTNQAMRTLVTALVNCVPMLINVLALWMLVFVLFGIVGMQLWMGQLHNCCTDMHTGARLLDEVTSEARRCGGRNRCPAGYSCSNKNPLTGEYWGNPNAGTTSFDNYGWSVVTLFQSMTMEGWVAINFFTWDVMSVGCIAYWLTLMLFCAYFVVSLATAVVYSNFSKADDDEKEALNRANSMAEEAAAQKQAAAAINGERCSSFSERSSGGDPGSPSQRRLMMLAQTKAKKSNSLSKGVNGVQRSSLLEETLRAATIKNHPLNKGPSLVFNSNRVLPETMNVDAIVAAALKEEEESTAAPPPDDSTTGVTDAIVAAALKEEEECTATPPPDDSIPSAGPLTEAFQVAPGTAEESTPPSDSKQQAKEEPDRASRRSSFNGAKDMASLGLASTRQFAATSLRKYSTSRRVVLGVIESAAFENAVLLVILLNTASLAMDHHQMSKDLEDSLELANYVFSGIFALEMFLKIFGLGVRGYVADKFNVFDGIIVAVSFVEILDIFPAGSSFTALRGFRLMRILKLVRRWKSIQRVVTVIASSLPAIGAFICVLFIVIFAFAIFGMEFFGDNMFEPSACHIDGETLVLDITMDDQGRHIMLADSTAAAAQCAELGGVWMATHSRTNFRNVYWACLTVFQIISSENWHEVLQLGVRNTSNLAVAYFMVVMLAGHYVLLNLFLAAIMKQMETLTTQDIETRKAEKEEEFERSMRDGVPLSNDDDQELSWECWVWRREYSMWLFHPESWLRVQCTRLHKHRLFEMLILFSILVSCVLLTMDDPHSDKRDTSTEVVQVLDTIFSIVFALELLVKVISMGFDIYLRDSWNCLDSIIVASSVLSLMYPLATLLARVGGSEGSTSSLAPLENLNKLKALRALRVLRALRLLSHNPELQLVVMALVKSMPAVANISCFLLMEWFIVAILGVQLFKGRFYLCSNGEMVIEGTINCQDGGTAANFDNTWEALLTVMELSTLEDWPSYMYHGIDAQPYPKPPVRDAYPANALFFVGFVICGAMFTLNLVVSAIVNHYLAFKEECEGRGLTLSEDQYRWVQSTRLMLRFKLERRPLAPTQPEGIPWLRRLRRRVFRLVHKQRFDNFISLCILISVILMLCSHFDASDTFENVTEGINAVLSFIFLCEALLKLFGLGLRGYFSVPWNVFDFTIVCTSLISLGFLLTGGAGFQNVSVLRGFRAVRALRTLRMIRGASGVRTLLQTFMQSLPSLYNVGSLLVLVFFMWAVLGVELFGNMPRQAGGVINERINFSTFGWAFFTLFTCCTGENWSQIFHACREHTWLAVPFFASFLIISSWLLVNLWIAVILDNFDEAQSMEDQTFFTRTDIAFFAKHWAKFDPKAEEVIRTEDLPKFLRNLGKDSPLGIETDDPTDNWIYADEMKALDIPDHHGFVHYYEVLWPLAHRLIGTDLPESEGSVLSKLVRRKFPKILRLAEPTAQFYEVLAANSIQRIWRGHRVRRKAKRKLAELARATGASPTPSAATPLPPSQPSPQGAPQSSPPTSDVQPARELSASLEALNSGKSKLPPLETRAPSLEPSFQRQTLDTASGEFTLGSDEMLPRVKLKEPDDGAASTP